MRNYLVGKRRVVLTGLGVLVLVIVGVAATSPGPSAAHERTSTVTIVNNSSREIRHVYFSPSDQNSWGPDQLNESIIVPGGTFALNNSSCPGSDIKVIAEDEDGCFFYQVVACGQDSNWTIASNAVRDCGS